jgi:hypothetical protein
MTKESTIKLLLRGLLLMLLACLTVALSILFALYRQDLVPYTPTGVSYKTATPIIGGFSIDTPQRAENAQANGIQVVFKYNQPPDEKDSLGQKLQALHMKVIDGYISSHLYYYECHRTKTVKPPPSPDESFCQEDVDPSLSSEDALLAAITKHLQQVKNNQLVVGYWALDDWISWDAGSARPLLIKIHDLIQQYTPGRPAICGFGGSIRPDTTVGWSDWLAQNFSPQGCDMVGLYLYASALPDSTPPPPSNSYDWSMSDVLPAMLTSLKQRGWDIAKEPLIGIGQVFGGPVGSTNEYWITPDAKDIEAQSKSFCEHGATGLVFYAWNDSEFGPQAQTPMNSPQIQAGIKQGIAACRQLWSK